MVTKAKEVTALTQGEFIMRNKIKKYNIRDVNERNEANKCNYEVIRIWGIGNDVTRDKVRLFKNEGYQECQKLLEICGR